MPTKQKPKILWNAKDAPWLPSGYGVITKHLVPRLSDHYGEDSVIVYAPVYVRDETRIWYPEGFWHPIKVLPGVEWDFGEDLIFEHYRRHDRNMLLQVGDFLQLKTIPQLAAQDQILWVQWAPFDWLITPDIAKDILRYPLKIVPFTKYGEQRFKDLGCENITDAIWLGIDPKIWFPINRSELTNTMSSLGFREDSYNILIAQANQRRKYIREMLEGVSTFHKTHPEANTRLYLHSWATKGEENLEQALVESGLADITVMTDQYKLVTGGFSESDLNKIYNCADVALDCCFEGFGFSMLQAQAVGVPAIGLLEGPTQEIVSVGVMVPTHHIDYSMALQKPVPDPVFIADSLANLWENQVRKSMFPVPRVRENFSWDKIAEQWIEVIDRVMLDREQFTMYIPEPSKKLKRQAREIIEV
jgi:glycosyltransferase involved in cell wall biosynthesis